MTVTFMDWGATWLSAILPLKNGEQRELLLGCPTPADYLHQAAYLGATVGRYANRIANAQITLMAKQSSWSRTKALTNYTVARRVSMPSVGRK